MKGVILAGGNGTRLNPLTFVTSKHLLPVYNKPMIYWPLETLIACSIRDILIITGRRRAKDFPDLLGRGEGFGVKLSYEIQETAGGIAHALSLAEGFTRGEKAAVILGDNIFFDADEIKQGVEDFYEQKEGAKIFLKSVTNPDQFGVATLQDDIVVDIEEKPLEPKSNLIVTGMYLFDSKVFDIIRTIKPSARGELEITDVNNCYIKNGTMTYQILTEDWIDAGTFDSLLEANISAAKLDKEKGLK